MINRKRRSSNRYSSESLEPRVLLTDTPAFSSLEGADKTILLDFDGHEMTGEIWNRAYGQEVLVAQPYSADTNYKLFSAKERVYIEDVFKRVSEDFIPFEVNVTTLDPGDAAMLKSDDKDTQYGIRVIITFESSMVTDPRFQSGVGGRAADSWGSSVLNFAKGPKNIAETSSHEVGHALGLRHDGVVGGAAYYQGHGSKETSWAPIMGLGYVPNVTQWNRAGYYKADNTQDDLLVLTTKGGLKYREDDHGNTDLEASVLEVTGTTFAGAGIIETSQDVDVFSFITNAGAVSVNVKPFVPGPNLDTKVELYDANGTLVFTSDSVASLSSIFTVNLDAGQYFIHVDGTGFGGPMKSSARTGYSDYGSLGRYFISGVLIAPTFACLARKRVEDLIDRVFCGWGRW